MIMQLTRMGLLIRKTIKESFESQIKVPKDIKNMLLRLCGRTNDGDAKRQVKAVEYTHGNLSMNAMS